MVVKASADVEGYAITLKDGSDLPAVVESEEGDDGYTYWTITTSVDRLGRMMLKLIPITGEGEQDVRMLPVMVQ